MHEMSLVESVIESILDLKEKNDWKKINRITLKIGKMRQVIPDIMEFAYTAASKSTELEGSDMVIMQVEMEFFCKSCNRRWGEEDMAFICPYCGSSEVEMIHGMELEIDSMEVED
jgi:hydrogenase nickel incorporation protein HypA/HybF